MSGGLGNWFTPAPESWLSRILSRPKRHPDEFDCGVRVLEGTTDGESGKWSYRRSAVDAPLPGTPSAGVTLQHGATRLRLEFAGDERQDVAGVRRHFLVCSARELLSGALLEVAVEPANHYRLLSN